LSYVDFRGHSEEQAVLDDSGDAIQLAGEGLGIFDGTERAIQDVIAVIGGEIAALGLGAKVAETARGGLPSERHHFHGQQTDAQLVDQFGFVDHDEKARTGYCHDLLAQECAAASLDQTEPRIHFIGTVDSDLGSNI
jgi:hypothetical protein